MTKIEDSKYGYLNSNHKSRLMPEKKKETYENADMYHKENR